ncbi:MAG: ribonucleoside triphosphate reductase, partial [Pseudobutyrivibrio sp.]|nr:ribonucleoside triphosphate reductase [Pseudobutyrivibrio sp.]
MFEVVKRDGEVAEFNLGKINDAIAKAFEATGKAYNDDIIGLLSLRVSADFQAKIKDSKISVEDIQDSVENVLEQTGYTDVAKAYILYRKQREKMRNMKSTVLDYKNVVDSYVKVEDWRVKENSTVTYSVGGLILSNSGAITANYWLSEIYDEEIANAHRNADIHIHDLSMLTGYCAGWSLKQLIQEGLGGITGKITSAPAKHLSVLCNQMVNFLGIMQNEWAGAQAFSSFDTYLAPFVKYDNLSYEEVKKCLEAFIYGVNTPSRWGTQAPFSNITLDWTVPNDLAELPAIVGGKEQDFKYKDCKKEMDMVNKAFLEIMIEGDANGRGFQYPIPTYS